MIKRHLRRYKKIFVAGLPSSGSTFVYQIVKELGYKPQKIHHFTAEKGLKIVTYRDPRDMICSTANRQTKKNYPHLNEKERYKQAYLTLFNETPKTQDILHSYANAQNTLLIKYEDYFGGNEYQLFKIILKFLKDNEREDKILSILEKYSIEENLKKSKNLGDFKNYDKKTHLHGNHISNKGKIGYWKDELPEEILVLVNDNLQQFMKNYGYQ